jgi:hypothetical protein
MFLVHDAVVRFIDNWLKDGGYNSQRRGHWQSPSAMVLIPSVAQNCSKNKIDCVCF